MSGAGNIFERVEPPRLPPLFCGVALEAGADPLAKAHALALTGCDAGTLVHAISERWLRAALVLAPEMPLSRAMAALIACELGLQNALGALAPPEVAVHLTWDGRIRVNGGECGHFRALAPESAPDAMPDWLVIGFALRLRPEGGAEEGLSPDRTSLHQEGCGAILPERLLESWARHTLLWLNRLEAGEREALQREWRPLVEEIGRKVALDLGGRRHEGLFVGVDADFGMLLRDGAGNSRTLPLSLLLGAQGA